jgi:SRSO17 transposase
VASRRGSAPGRDEFLIVDDTGFPKQGRHSVGVARQYSGTLGKVANCQIAVTLQHSLSGRTVCVDAGLYLPEKGWCDDRECMRRAGVPDEVGYRPKWPMVWRAGGSAGANAPGRWRSR